MKAGSKTAAADSVDARVAPLPELADVQQDLEHERETSRTLTAQLATARAAKETAEALSAEAQQAHQQIVAGYADQVRSLEAKLEALRIEQQRLATDLALECAERRRVLAVLDSIRSALGGSTPAAPVTAPAPSVDRVPAESTVPGAAETASSETKLPVGAPAAAEPPAKPTWSEYATQLLNQIESSYNDDVSSLERPAEVVDCLTEYLRIAHDLFRTRFKDEALAPKEFDRQMSIVLDTKGATLFGRHLGLAWYAISQPERIDARRPRHEPVLR